MSKLIHGSNVAGQSVVDRVLAAKHTVAGQSLAKVICKATTEEVMGPKRKHLDYLVQCTNAANVSIPEMANLLIERTQNANWVVVFKSLVTVHNLMNYGNERFTQYLASNNCTFNLNNFADRSGTQGYDMSNYIRRYAKYLNEKALSYRLMAFDFCKVKRGKDDGILRTMVTEKLLRTLPFLQTQLDILVDFDVSASELTNGVINAAFMLLFKDLIRLFACYNDGIINLLEKYFEMNKKNCKEALDIYKKFLLRMDKVCNFLKVAENVGIDKGDIPDLAKAPSSLLEALEQHLASLENNKKTGLPATKPTSGVSTVISNYATASQLGTAPGAGAGLNDITEDERRYILEEEQRQLDQLKKKLNGVSSPPGNSLSSGCTAVKPPSLIATESVPNTNSRSSPFLSVGTDPLFGASPNPTNSLFSSVESDPLSPHPASSLYSVSQPHDSLTFLDSFADSNQMAPLDSGISTIPFASSSQQLMMTAPSLFTSHPGFNNSTNFLEPSFPSASSVQSNVGSSEVYARASPLSSDKLVKTDLDSSLAFLAGNLNMRTSSQVKKTDHQWYDAGERRLTGSRSTWSPFPESSNQSFQSVGVAAGNTMPDFVQPAAFTPFPQSMVSQTHPMMVGQSSGMMWMPAQPLPYTQTTSVQPNFKAQQFMSDNPFGSM